MNTIGQEIMAYNLITPQDVASAAETSTTVYVSMAGAKSGCIIITAHLTASKTADCQLTCASDTAGTGKEDVSGKTVSLGDSTGGEYVDKIDFDVHDLDLDDSKYFVGVDVTTNQSGDDIAATLITARLDYAYGDDMF